MKFGTFLGLMLIASLGGEAAAQCTGGQITNGAGTFETATVTFQSNNPGNGLNSSQSVTLQDGSFALTFTASANHTIPQVAARFANLPGSVVVPSTVTGGAYSGTFSGWTSGAVAGNSVTFTRNIAGNVPNITGSASVPGPTAPTIVTTDGTGGPALTNLMTGSLVCGRPGAGYPGAAGDRWQEQHRTGGQVWDFKLGVGHAVDPEKQVGTYSFTGTGTSSEVVNNYGSSVFNWRVYLISGNTYAFCTAANVEHVRAFVTANGTSGQGCGGSFP